MRNQNLLLVALALVFAVALHAEKPEKQAGPCKADIEKFCKDVPRGEGRVMECLKKNEANLSAECKAKRDERKDDKAAFRKACKDDAKKLCAEAAKGAQGVRACLKEKAAQTSPACQAELAKIK